MKLNGENPQLLFAKNTKNAFEFPGYSFVEYRSSVYSLLLYFFPYFIFIETLLPFYYYRHLMLYKGLTYSKGDNFKEEHNTSCMTGIRIWSNGIEGLTL